LAGYHRRSAVSESQKGRFCADKATLSLVQEITDLRSCGGANSVSQNGRTVLRKTLLLAAAALTVCFSLTAYAQTYPDRPIRLIVPFPPGGGTDLTARIVAEALTKSLGQNVIVENKPGAGSQIGIDQVARAPKDGYTLLWASSDGISILPAVKTVPYKVPAGFTFIQSYAQYPLILGVSSKLPIHDLKEFIDYARAHPGKLHYASSGAGGGGHLYPAYVGKTIGAEMVHVPFDGAGPAAVAVAGGFADFCDIAPSSVASYISAGTVRGVATSGLTRSSLLPDVPTMTELGQPDLAMVLYYGMLGPAGMPQAIADKLRAAVHDVLVAPGMTDRLHSLGLEPLDRGGTDFRDFVDQDAKKWQTIADAVHVRIGG
jgi:tripartite-type tricarboxylate transporter receptor subunit TctC